MPRVLLIDDDKDFCDLLCEELASHGYEVEWRESAEHGAPLLLAAEAGPFDVLLLDNRLRGKNGLKLLEELRQQGVRIPVILITGHGTADIEIEAFKLGVLEFITKPVRLVGQPLHELRHALDRAAETSRLMKEPVRLPGEVGTGGLELMGRPGCEPMSQVYQLIGKKADAARRECPVLITGETGTGKELVARALFHRSARRDGPFLKVKWEAFHEKELDVELFGYEGGDRQQIGVFEKAHGGAVLLDDAGETSRSVQAKVLQVIDDGIVIRGGRGTKVAVDVWVIGCAQRDFVSDLYFRLMPPIHLPPLRERGEDVDVLAACFLERAAAAVGKPWVQSFHEQAREKLRHHCWPGNVRELQQAIHTAVLLCRGTQITVANLKLGPSDSVAGEVATHLRRAIQAALQSGQANLYAFLNGILAREVVQLTWTATAGNLEQTAGLAGLPLPEVRKVLQEGLGIDPPHAGDPDKKLPPSKGLSPSRVKAWGWYNWALERNPALAGRPDAEVFRWLQNDSRVAREDLPTRCDTFERYLREARAHYDDHKNTPPLDRPTGRSIVRLDQI
jgi:DNA-binding NtrC family response regulator